MDNFLGMNRQVLRHWTYSDIYAWRVWSHILFSAQFSKNENHVNINGYWITQEYGEFLFGRESWSKLLQVPEQRLRTLMKKFEKEGMIRKTEKGNSRCTVYLVCNYEKFNHSCNQHSNQQDSLQPQSIEDNANQHSNHDSNQRLTGEQPATNHNKEYNKNIEEDKTISKKDVSKFFEKIWEFYPVKKGKASVSDKQKRVLYDIGYEELKRCFDRYVASKESWKAYQQGSTFFNSGYVDYLDKNYSQQALPIEELTQSEKDALKGWGING